MLKALEKLKQAFLAQLLVLVKHRRQEQSIVMVIFCFPRL